MSRPSPLPGASREAWAQLRNWQDTAGEPGQLVIETSGSTGERKRVLLSRRAMRASAAATARRLGGPGQWLLALPSSYVAGAQVLFRSALAGAEPVFLAEHDDLSAAVAATKGQRRYTSLVPTQLTRMLSNERDVAALRSFDTILLGGAATGSRLLDAAERSGLRVVATYGMSETCGGCVYDGVALDGVAVAVSDTGRVRISGPVLFDGYDGRPDLTSQVLKDGWFLTSDFGRLDDDGRLQVLGRMDDVVISGGVKVPTAAVAARTLEHPHVLDVAVVGVPDREWGQAVVAVVVTSADVALGEIRDLVGESHPRAWAPRRLVAANEIPLLVNGKVDRRGVERLAAGEPSPERCAAQPETGGGHSELGAAQWGARRG
ncbi:MAG: AMP-binding protein [Actinomycetota bacterium]|nr:AMP-binding protein [Actinomycetota bacterium]